MDNSIFTVNNNPSRTASPDSFLNPSDRSSARRLNIYTSEIFLKVNYRWPQISFTIPKCFSWSRRIGGNRSTVSPSLCHPLTPSLIHSLNNSRCFSWSRSQCFSGPEVFRVIAGNIAHKRNTQQFHNSTMRTSASLHSSTISPSLHHPGPSNQFIADIFPVRLPSADTK